MSAPTVWKDLSAQMQYALACAYRQGIPVEEPRKVGVQRRTANALEEHGLLVQRKTQKRKLMWRPTEQGRSILVAHEPNLLHRSSDALYTSDPRKAMFAEPEAVDDEALAASRRAAHEREHGRFEQLLEQRRRLPLTERLRRALNDAEARGIPIERPLYVIAQRVAEIEKRVYQPADRFADAEPGGS